MAIRIGCGSWTDQDYVGLLYAKGTKPADRLRAYPHWFERVEVNASYYAIPTASTVAHWADQTPASFLFDLKLPRTFSEAPHRAATSAALPALLRALEPLIAAKKLGGFLLTLSPSFSPDQHRLDELDLTAQALLPIAPLAVELRHRGWIHDARRSATLAFFRERKLTWVALDLPPINASAVLPPLDEVTTPSFAYVRLHGRNPRYLEAKTAAERHRHDYTPAELAEIAARIRSLAARAKDVHVSVNNHYADFAPKAALALRRLLGQPVPSSPPVHVDGDGQRSLFE